MNTQTVKQPENPIQAVTAPNPYPYYRELVRQRPFHYDETLGVWVAASAETVRLVLSSDLCRVRPTAEPVPKALFGSSAGKIFARLVRMIDGRGHHLKQAISATLAGIDKTQFEASCQKWADSLSRSLFGKIQPNNSLALFSEYAFHLPIFIMGDLLGISDDQLSKTTEWVRDFVCGISPLSNPTQIDRGNAASRQLWDHAQALLTSQQSRQVDGLFGQLADEVGQSRLDTLDRDETVVANGIGFLSQAYEATAGLIGNTIVTLARHPETLRRVKAEPGLIPQVILEVLRFDAPVQNTRRYVAEDGVVSEHAMKAGDTILVILAAANHDPAVNPDPDRFDIFRKDRQIFTFGIGGHTCPGQNLAVGIASAGIEQLIDYGADFSRLVEGFSYQDSVNARIPIFMSAARSEK